jgi:hypothetical protein
MAARLVTQEAAGWILWLPAGQRLLAGALSYSYAVDTSTYVARPFFFLHIADGSSPTTTSWTRPTSTSRPSWSPRSAPQAALAFAGEEPLRQAQPRRSARTEDCRSYRDGSAR